MKTKPLKIFKDEDGNHQVMIGDINITQQMLVVSVDVSITADDVPYATIKIALPDGVEIDTDADINYEKETEGEGEG